MLRRFSKSLFKSKALRHPNATKLRSFLCTVMVDEVIFVTDKKCVYVKYKRRASSARELPDFTGVSQQ